MKKSFYSILFLGSKTYYIRNRITCSYLSWKKCSACGLFLFYQKIVYNKGICYKCGFHFNISSRERIKMLFKGNFIDLYNFILPSDILKFYDTKHYYSKLVDAQMNTNEIEALLVFKSKIDHIDIIVCIFEFKFIGGSMGCVVGQKFTSAINFSIKHKLPLVCFSSSGGVRMQESVISLLQMTKVSFMLNMFNQYKLPYLSIIINPCMGGVSASLAMLGDIIMAEPKALIGFTGPRIIKNVTGKILPSDFQSSEFLLKNGFLDFIVDRKFLHSKILNVLKILMKL